MHYNVPYLLAIEITLYISMAKKVVCFHMAMLCANVNQTLCCVHQIIQGLMHLSAYNTNVVDTIYLMDHYTAGVNLFGDRAIVRRQSLPKVICSTIGDGTQDRHHNTHS